VSGACERVVDATSRRREANEAARQQSLLGGLDPRIGDRGEGDAEALAQTPLRRLIAGLDDIGGLAIPYARLPRRAHSAFGAEFSCWSDIAGHTVESLLRRPRAGEATVRAVLAAAHDAVAKHQAGASGQRVGSAAAVARLLDELDARDRLMASARSWAQPPLPQGGVAQQLGVTNAWVNRNQPRVNDAQKQAVASVLRSEIVSEGKRSNPKALLANALFVAGIAGTVAVTLFVSTRCGLTLDLS
jgi:hypothetical protein